MTELWPTDPATTGEAPAGTSPSTSTDPSTSTSTEPATAPETAPGEKAAEPTPADPPAASPGDVVRLDGYAETEPERYALVVDVTDGGVLVIDLPGVPREHQLGTSPIAR
jgi:hypothetical protein